MKSAGAPLVSWRITPLILFLFTSTILLAQMPPPPGGGWTPPPRLDSWSFNDVTNWTTDRGYAPVSFSNIEMSEFGDIGDGFSVMVDSTNSAWLQYNLIETNGATNLTIDSGTLTLWFCPNWASATTNQNGTGPGDWGRLLEVGSYTPGATYGWWSLLTDPGGTNIYFAAQTNSGDGATTTYLSAPIDWATNEWHMLALAYSSTNTALYIDGELATTGSGVTVYPGLAVQTNGFWVGSDSNGVLQAHAEFDDIYTYAYPLGSSNILNLYLDFSSWYAINPFNVEAFVTSAPSSPTNAPAFNAIAGTGYLIPVKTNIGCITSSSVWITNVLAASTTNGMTITFTVGGGSNAVPYDVFANSVLAFGPNTNTAWAWMGQGYQCVTYTLTNLPNSACFLILGTPVDSDSDGLTDAYERLVSKTNPLLYDTVGDGISDADKVLLHLNPLAPAPELPPTLTINSCPQ